MKTKDEQFGSIAKDYLFIETLETRRSDALDFHDVAVWQVRDALEAAYEMGRKSKLRKKGDR